MPPLDLPLRRFLEGAFYSSLPTSGANVPAEKGPSDGTPVEIPAAWRPELPDPDVAATFLEWLECGMYLRALSMLKLLLPQDPNGRYLKPMLAEALAIEPPSGLAISTERAEPVPREFLGSERLHLAWSVLERDTLEWSTRSDRHHATADEWVVTEEVVENPGGNGETPGCTSDAQDATSSDSSRRVLLWRSKTEVAGKLRPAGDRNVARHRAELQVSIALLGPDREHFGVQRLEGEVKDLSAGGVGTWIADPLKKLEVSELLQHRVRLELLVAEQVGTSTLAVVRWVKSTTDERGSHGWQVGLKFFEPTLEFGETVEQLLKPGKGDVQFLWNLWQSNAKRA